MSSRRSLESLGKMTKNEHKTSPSDFRGPHKSKKSSLSRFSTSQSKPYGPVRLKVNKVNKALVEARRVAQKRREVPENTQRQPKRRQPERRENEEGGFSN